MGETQSQSAGGVSSPLDAYQCPEPGCTKTYKRREHLSRHRLNHKPKKIYTCEQCRKSFVRPDLLQRHQKRHEQGMVLRNSGGYHGPRSASRSISLTEDVPDPGSAFPSPRLWSTRPSSLAPGDTTRMLPPPPPLLNQNTEQQQQAPIPTMEAGISLAVFPDLLPEPNPDFQHQLFFDPSTNMVDTAADLDWLFGLAPICSDDLDADLTLANTTAVPSESPASTLSDQAGNNGELTPGDLPDPWIRARESLINALHGLPPDVFETSFFSIPNLHAMWDAYFAGYHPHFPIIHKPTTVAGTIQPLLLIAILSLGATLTPDIELYYAAERIHDRLRWFIFSSGSFQPPAPLWLLQALLLVQAYEKMASSRKNHEMSHIFHGAVITLMRRGASYNDTSKDHKGRESSVERAWHRWIEQESSKRVAYFAFVMDAQHASVFSHAPALSVSDLRLPLPFAEAAWEAPTPTTWKRALAAHAEPLAFLPSLRGLLAGRPIPSSASPFARFILLHGLFSVMKHMQLRDLTALDVAERTPDPDAESPGLGGDASEPNWKDIMHRAIDTWSFSLLFQAPSVCLEAARPLHRIAHIVTHIPLVDFHTFVGAPPLVSNRVTKDEYDKARARLQEWSQTAAAKRALSHCVLLVQETMFTRRRYRAAEDEIALRPWCLYHASLVLWTYGVMTEGLPTTTATDTCLGAEEYLVHMLSGFMGEPNSIAHKNQTSGLLAAVRESLDGCRWQLLQEAQTTLQKLIDMVPEGSVSRE